MEKAVSSGTVWSPLPCPPLPSHPQGLSELVPLTVVMTISVTTFLLLVLSSPISLLSYRMKRSLYCWGQQLSMSYSPSLHCAFNNVDGNITPPFLLPSSQENAMRYDIFFLILSLLLSK